MWVYGSAVVTVAGVAQSYGFDGTPDGHTTYSRAPDDALLKAIAKEYSTDHGRMQTMSSFEGVGRDASPPPPLLSKPPLLALRE